MLCYKISPMKLTLAEKTVIGTNILLVLILLSIFGLQFIIDSTDVNLRHYFRPPPAASPATTDAANNNIGLTIAVPEPTTDEELGADEPRRAWVGWTIIIVSGLLVILGLGIKFLQK